MTKPNLAALCAAFLTCLVILSPVLHAQVIYVDYPPIAWQSKRLIELDKPIGVRPQPYKTPFLDFQDFKAEFPHTEWLPPTMTILPPEDADTSTSAWALALIQDTVHGDRLPILLFFTHVGKANAMTYIDYDFNGNFRDDGPPMLLGNQMVPRAVEMVSHLKHGYRFYIAESRPVKIVLDDGNLRLFRFSLTGYSGAVRLYGRYAYSEPNKENYITLFATGYAFGVLSKFDYNWRSLAVSANVGLDLIDYRYTAYRRYQERTTCNSAGICTTRVSSFTTYNQDSIPTARFILGSEISWMPKIARGIRIGPLVSGGCFLYTPGTYRPRYTKGRAFSMNPTGFLEGGLQSWIDLSPQHYVIFRGTVYQNNFRPKGFFEYFNARDVETRQWGMRIGGGYGWRF